MAMRRTSASSDEVVVILDGDGVAPIASRGGGLLIVVGVVLVTAVAGDLSGWRFPVLAGVVCRLLDVGTDQGGVGTHPVGRN